MTDYPRHPGWERRGRHGEDREREDGCVLGAHVREVEGTSSSDGRQSSDPHTHERAGTTDHEVH